ncbi:MAG: hypothetical protein HW408_137 [Actinobacteria bacterium]|nr:hypothetical protein [Actinomycetota bacterium]
MKRINLRSLLILLLAASVLTAPAWPASGSNLCGKEPRQDTRLADETLKSVVLLPDREVSLSGTLFLINARASRDLFCREADGRLVESEINRIARRVRTSAAGDDDPAGVISAITRVLFEEEKFIYDPSTGNPEYYLLDRVLARKRGNCLGMTVVYLAVAERLEIPLGSVYVPSHSFIRYEGNGARINVETGMEGTEQKDEWYAKKYNLKENSPYLRTLGRREIIGVYLKTLGAAYSRKGMEEEALHVYREAALFSPKLPDAYFNAGVSYQKMGRNEEAIDQYRRALALYPDMESARGNLASALCGCGRVEDGIREFRKALEINPRNAIARSGLARAYFAQGAYREAAEHCDRAMEQGCRFDSPMLEILSRYRIPGAISTGP